MSVGISRTNSKEKKKRYNKKSIEDMEWNTSKQSKENRKERTKKQRARGCRKQTAKWCTQHKHTCGYIKHKRIKPSSHESRLVRADEKVRCARTVYERDVLNEETQIGSKQQDRKRYDLRRQAKGTCVAVLPSGVADFKERVLQRWRGTTS